MIAFFEYMQINSMQSIDQNLVEVGNSGGAWGFFLFSLSNTSDEIHIDFSHVD